MTARVLLLLILMLMVSGCANYQSHYGKFTAANSAGERRAFLISWKTAEYPAWMFRESEYTPVRVQSQCSKREWSLDEGQCGNGISACGKPGKDLNRQGQMISADGYVCMKVSDREGAERIAELDSPVLLTVSCYPNETEHQVDGEKENIDYLKASSVPYTVHIKTAPLYSLDDRPPTLDEKICKAE